MRIESNVASTRSAPGWERRRQASMLLQGESGRLSRRPFLDRTLRTLASPKHEAIALDLWHDQGCQFSGSTGGP